MKEKSHRSLAEIAARNRDAYRAADLLSVGYKPGPSELAVAPSLDDWRCVLMPSGCAVIVGNVTGHPRLSDGVITTSAILAIDVSTPGAAWARTYGRWYKLGAQHVPQKSMEPWEPDLAEDFPDDSPAWTP